MTGIYENFRQDRVMIFIDLRNLMGNVRDDADVCKLNFVTIVNILCNHRRLVAAYVFDGKNVVDGDDRSRTFHDYLSHLGFRVVARDCYSVEENRQKEVDVSLACQMLRSACHDQYDVAILVSGDRDYVPAVEAVQSEGKKVELAFYKSNLSSVLKTTCDSFQELDSMPILEMSGYTSDEGGEQHE